MKKTLYIAIFAILALVSVAFAAGDLDVTPAVATENSNIGQEITNTLTITNSNTTDDIDVSLPASIELSGVTVSLTYNTSNSLTIPADKSVDVNYTFTVPSEQPGTYQGKINITDDATESNYAEHTLSLSIKPGITLNNPSMTVTSGFENVAVLTITNVDVKDVSITSITVTDLVSGNATIASSKVSFSPAVLVVADDASKNVNVTVDATSAESGTYTGTITVSYDGVTAQSTITVVVEAPVKDLSISESDLKFDDFDQNSTRTRTISLKNEGNVPLNNVVVSSDLDSKYEFTVSPESITELAAGASESLAISLYMPLTEDSGVHTIGNIVVESDEYNESFAIVVDVRGKLRIVDLDVKVGSESDKNLNNGDRIDKEAKPEDEISFALELQNGYTDDEDIDIEDVLVTITIFEIDDGDDLEEESKEFKVKADDKEKVTLDFTLPLEVDEGNYDVQIEVEGQDENGVDQRVVWELELVVEKDRHAVLIYKSALDDVALSCQRTTDLVIEVVNIGQDNEDDVVLTIQNDDLSINVKKSFELDNDPFDEDSKYKMTVPISLPSNFPVGSYPIIIKAYYDTDNLDDYKTVDLKVEKCSITVEDDEDTPVKDDKDDKVEDVIVITPPTTTPNAPDLGDEVKPVTTVKRTQSFTESGAYMWLLILANVVVVGLILFVVAKYVIASRKEE